MMKSIFLAAVLSALALPAHAGSLSISATTGGACPTVTAPSGGATSTQCIAGTDAQMARVTAAYKALYGQICNTASPPVCRDRTNAETFQALARGIFDGIKANVQSYEKSTVRKTAEDGVAQVGLE